MNKFFIKMKYFSKLLINNYNNKSLTNVINYFILDSQYY